MQIQIPPVESCALVCHEKWDRTVSNVNRKADNASSNLGAAGGISDVTVQTNSGHGDFPCVRCGPGNPPGQEGEPRDRREEKSAACLLSSYARDVRAAGALKATKRRAPAQSALRASRHQDLLPRVGRRPDLTIRDGDRVDFHAARVGKSSCPLRHEVRRATGGRKGQTR